MTAPGLVLDPTLDDIWNLNEGPWLVRFFETKVLVGQENVVNWKVTFKPSRDVVVDLIKLVTPDGEYDLSCDCHKVHHLKAGDELTITIPKEFR